MNYELEDLYQHGQISETGNVSRRRIYTISQHVYKIISGKTILSNIYRSISPYISTNNKCLIRDRAHLGGVY